MWSIQCIVNVSCSVLFLCFLVCCVQFYFIIGVNSPTKLTLDRPIPPVPGQICLSLGLEHTLVGRIQEQGFQNKQKMYCRGGSLAMVWQTILASNGRGLRLDR
jgi:hypothetical protein